MSNVNNPDLVDDSSRSIPENETAAEVGLLDHLTELRSRLIKALASVIPGFVVAYNLAGPIIDFLVRPLKAALPDGPGLIATGLPDTFFVHLKIGLWAGLFLSAPYWLYQLWAFVAPGLYRRERSTALTQV
jgi:sec-independent protein translocase protein TatC